VRAQNAPQRDLFLPESRKRARNSQDLVAEDSQRSERRSLAICRKGAISDSSDAMDQNGVSPRESESELRSHCGNGRQERVKQACHETAEGATYIPSHAREKLICLTRRPQTMDTPNMPDQHCSHAAAAAEATSGPRYRRHETFLRT
jgi:hypothetical protein